jgi:hypothetical protein
MLAPPRFATWWTIVASILLVGVTLLGVSRGRSGGLSIR